ncbi:MAG: hypothetical protein H0X25_03695 [Acidobacteriales bacterium]|nr:hypothetical protein [Terriglobales bacterium]
MKTNLDGILALDPAELLELLNDSPSKLASSSRPLRPKRTKEAAAELQRLLRNHVDQWLETGMQYGGAEAPGSRNFRVAEQSAWLEEGTAEEKRFALLPRSFPGNHTFSINFPLSGDPAETPLLMKFHLKNADAKNPHSAFLEAESLTMMLLMSDLRFRIAKCRYETCREPYFFLQKRQKKVWENGLFCCLAHNRAATATKRVRIRRNECQQRLIMLAAAQLRKRSQRGNEWYSDRSLKQELVTGVNRGIARDPNFQQDGITINWVTRHQSSIHSYAWHQSL